MNAAEQKSCAGLAKALKLPITTQIREFAFCGEEDEGDDDQSTNCVELDLSHMGLEGELDDGGSSSAVWKMLLKLPYLVRRITASCGNQ